jgi:hypothetical protein
VGFEPTIPAFEWAKTVHALDRAATVIGTDVIMVVKYRMMIWTGHAARMKETRIRCKLSVGKSEGNNRVGIQYEYGKAELDWMLMLTVCSVKLTRFEYGIGADVFNNNNKKKLKTKLCGL